MANIIAEEKHLEKFDEKNLKACCPFHEENTPSFIWNPKALTYHCFGACGRNYDIIDVFMSDGLTYLEAVQKLFELADIKCEFGEHHIKTKHQYRYPTPVNCTDKSKVYAYLESRKISPKTADYLDIRQDERGIWSSIMKKLAQQIFIWRIYGKRQISLSENMVSEIHSC